MIRGEDLLSSTPRQVLVYQALGAPVPSFAHLPLLFGPDRKRLSKRHGATSVEELREAGYLAEAVVNFLALLGWHFDSERELFTLSELIGLFSLERVNPAPAVFDAKKLEWMNGVYLRALPTFDLAERLIAYLAERGSPLAGQPERVIEVTPLAQEKIATLAEFEPLCSFLFGPVEIDQEAWEQGRGERARRRDPGRRADGAGQVRLDRRGDRGGAARRLRAARAQAARRLRPDSRGRDRLGHLAGPLRERAPARPRRVALSPQRGRRPHLLATRCATSAPSAWAQAENARPSREASTPSAAPAARARAGVRARAPGSAASVPSASWAARPAAGLPGATVRAMSARVRPRLRPAA